MAVHSTVDSDSLHVSMSNEGVCIGTEVLSESYLNMERIISAVMMSGADAKTIANLIMGDVSGYLNKFKMVKIIMMLLKSWLVLVDVSQVVDNHITMETEVSFLSVWIQCMLLMTKNQLDVVMKIKILKSYTMSSLEKLVERKLTNYFTYTILNDSKNIYQHMSTENDFHGN